MRIWLLAVRHGLLVHQKIVLLLSTSMAGSLVMASALLQEVKRLFLNRVYYYCYYKVYYYSFMIILGLCTKHHQFCE